MSTDSERDTNDDRLVATDLVHASFDSMTDQRILIGCRVAKQDVMEQRHGTWYLVPGRTCHRFL
jgi:hypothetical protein